MLVVIVEFRLKPGSRDRFIDRVRRQASDSLRNESGCHVFDICLDPTRENKVLLYEVYTDEAAFEAHLASAHFRDFEDDVGDWVRTKKIDRLTRIEA